jgi:hypothetical protein
MRLLRLDHKYTMHIGLVLAGSTKEAQATWRNHMPVLLPDSPSPGHAYEMTQAPPLSGSN